MVPSSRPVTPNTIAGDGDLVRPDSVNGSAYGHKPPHMHDTDDIMAESRAVPMNDMTSEKGLAC